MGNRTKVRLRPNVQTDTEHIPLTWACLRFSREAPSPSPRASHGAGPEGVRRAAWSIKSSAPFPAPSLSSLTAGQMGRTQPFEDSETLGNGRAAKRKSPCPELRGGGGPAHRPGAPGGLHEDENPLLLWMVPPLKQFFCLDQHTFHCSLCSLGNQSLRDH